ncbi:MAG: alpha/beta hydrolase [Thermoanaerobaculia bacterium]
MDSPRRLTISTEAGVEIVWDHYLNESSSRAFLVVPGFWRHRRHPAITALASRLQERGGVAVMDIRGHGESGGRFGFNRSEHLDVAAVAAEMLRMTRASRLDMIGFSMGGAIAATAAARHPEIRWGKILLISPVADFRRLRPRLNPFLAHRHLSASQIVRAPRFDWGFWFHSKIQAEDEIGKVRVPVTIVHVRRDWLVDDSHGARLHERCRSSTLHLLEIPGRWHADRILTEVPEAFEPVLRDFLES